MHAECIFMHVYLYIFYAYPGIGARVGMWYLWEILPGLVRITISAKKWQSYHFLEIRRPMVRGRAAAKSHLWDTLPPLPQNARKPMANHGFPGKEVQIQEVVGMGIFGRNPLKNLL